MATIAASFPLPKLGRAAALDVPVELKLNWEDYPVLAGDRALDAVLAEHDVSPPQIQSVHLPPGTATRGREIGMAATRKNVGAVQQFVVTQLGSLPARPLIMHPVKRFDRDAYLPLLQQYLHLTDHPIYLENLSASSADLHTGAELREFVAAIADRNLPDLQLVIDTAHIPTAATEGWQPTVALLEDLGPHIGEIHLNDPVADGLPQCEQARAGLAELVGGM